MPKETGEKLIVQNKKARHDYAIEDKYEAGLALTGTEVKSLREGRASLSEAFISIDRRGEMWLEGANIPEYLNGHMEQPCAQAQAQAAAAPTADHQARPRHRSQGIHDCAAEPVLQGRSRQGGDRAGPRQEGIRPSARPREERTSAEALRAMRYANHAPLVPPIGSPPEGAGVGCPRCGSFRPRLTLP